MKGFATPFSLKGSSDIYERDPYVYADNTESMYDDMQWI